MVAFSPHRASGPHLADLRATDKSDTPGRAVSTQNTRAPLSTQIQIGCAPDRAGGRNLSRSCASVCPNRKHTPPAHATMLAMREHSVVSPWWHWSLAPARLLFHVSATFLYFFRTTTPQLSRNFRESFSHRPHRGSKGQVLSASFWRESSLFALLDKNPDF